MANTKLENLLTPGGRLISGSLTKKGDKDSKGLPILVEKQAYWFAVAVPKTAPGVDALIGQLWQLAATDYAQYPLVMQQINLGLAATAFSWKIDDGDVPQIDQKTGQYKPMSEHRKGCYIFGFRTMFEFGACDDKGIDIDRGSIKVGDYVDVMFNSTTNGNIDGTAGIYLNVQAIRRLGFGDSIGQEVKASSAFAGVAAVLPSGASVMPQAGSPMPGMGMPPAAGMPAAPVAPAAPPVPPPAAFPPAGWTAHPSAPGYFYMGNEVKSEAELRLMVPLAAAPVPPPMVPAVGIAMPGIPAAVGIASPSSYPQILTGGMPGVVR